METSNFHEASDLTLCILLYVDIFVGAFLGCLKWFYCLLILDVYLSWFPAINPWYPPIPQLRYITGWYNQIFKLMWPPLWIFDLSGIMAFGLLNELMDWSVETLHWIEKTYDIFGELPV